MQGKLLENRYYSVMLNGNKIIENGKNEEVIMKKSITNIIKVKEKNWT